jgi:hypothetical protein
MPVLHQAAGLPCTAGLVLALTAACSDALGAIPQDDTDRAPPVTIADRFKELRAKPPSRLSRQEIAFRSGVEFCLLVGVGNSGRAVEHLDVVGYQPLPLDGLLPEDPPRPIDAETVREWIASRPESNVDDAPVRCFRAVDRVELRERFAAVADWMLPSDYALLIEVAPQKVRHWVRRSACLVIRVRAGRASIVGGNLFQALGRD